MSHGKSRRCALGFSLVELICVLTTIAVMGGIAAPRYAAAAAHYRADATTCRIVADLRLAQANARATSVAQTLTFNTTNQRYQLSNIASLDNRSSSTYTVDLTASPYNAILTSVSFAGGQISFDNFGIPNAGGTIVIRTSTIQKTITVDGSSGQIVIQ